MALRNFWTIKDGKVLFVVSGITYFTSDKIKK